MSFANLLKRFNAAFFAQEEPVQETEEDRFLRFYRNLLAEISSHIEYQREMTNSVGEKSKVLKPFKVEEYAERINEFFRGLEKERRGKKSARGSRSDSRPENGGNGSKPAGRGRDRGSKVADQHRGRNLPEATVANLFFMILALPGQEQPAVSAEIRRRIFSRVAVRYAEDTGRQPAELLKSLYERLKHGRGDVFGSNTEELMEMLRSAATYIDVELREAEPDPGFTMAAEGPATEPPGGNAETAGLRREQLLKLLDASVKIKSDKDRRALLNPAAGLDFVVTGVVRLTAAFVLLFNTTQLAVYLSNLSDNTDQLAFYSAVIDLLGFTLVLWTLVSAVKFGRRMARRQLYKRLSTRFEELG